MRILVFEQVKSEDNKLFDEKFLFEFEGNPPAIGTKLYVRDMPKSTPAFSNQDIHIKEGIYQVLEVNYSICNYTTKYDIKAHVQILVETCD